MSINIEIKKEELICCICLDNLCNEIWSCANGPHYTCKKCKNKMEKMKCPICNHVDKPIRNIGLEQSIKKYVIFCKNGCGESIFNWSQEDHNTECSKMPIKCKFCKRLISTKCADMLKHYRDFCDVKFIITSFNLNKNKFKYIADIASSVLIVNNKIAIISTFKNDEYLISAISDDFEYLNKNIKINITNGKISTNAILKISSGKNINEHVNFHKSLGNIFNFELPSQNNNSPQNNNNPPQTSSDCNNDLYSELFNFYFRN
jgi:hypothetical protein